MAGTSSDYIYPIPELRRKLYPDREVLRQIVLEDQDTGFDLATNNLLELLMTHIYQFHHNSVEMLNFWEKVKQKYKFNQRDCHNIPKAMVNDNCSVHSGHVMSIKDIIVPTQICDYANNILLELKQIKNDVTCPKFTSNTTCIKYSGYSIYFRINDC